uniref:SCP domain-containing protein n=1 Tax=Caenorhabditis tropicalis TaxID=1561998 RepID=A0A1I7T9W6_9PELO
MHKVIIFLIAIDVLLEIHGAPIKKRLYQMDQEKFVDDLNALRLEEAKKLNISDFWKLEWSEDLVAKAYSMRTNDCLSFVPGFDYRYFYHEGNSDAIAYELSWINWFQSRSEYGDNDEQAARAEKELAKRTAYTLEKMHSLQSKVGCIPKECDFDIKMDNLKENVTYHLSYKYICFIGPHGQFPRGVHKGEPGSDCGSGGHNHGGLCVEN